ncbi:lysozyme inhibitor LprI family protein [Pelagovum pacificum]|uniref:lysozyme inhibitor LprI family protein n=1 Tax=Pelagovum pacificum TaxID=2588711 RepID=UPI0022B0E899|nr:lysozyme inhibitor LprI family protein [Pelagovum pacificum]
MGPLALAFALLLGVPDGSAAEELDCSDGGTTQMEMNACSQRDYEAADVKLNEAWGEAIETARTFGYDDKLLTAQRAWITYRDAACEAEAATFEGGSMAPLVRNSCLARLTETRTEDLTIFNELDG